MVCISLGGNTVDEVLEAAEQATAEGADIFEVRFDKLYVEPVEITVQNDDGVEESSIEHVSRPVEDVDVMAAIGMMKKAINKPVLFTCRGKDEGGEFPSSEKNRLDILKQAIESGVSWIDLEMSIEDKALKNLTDLASENGTKVVLSHHDTETTPDKDEIISRVEEHASEAEIVKVCFNTRNHDDALSLFEAAWELKDKTVSYTLMGMGIGGDWPRLHAPLLRQAMVYTTLETAFNLTDRGMVNVNDLRIAWKMLGHA